MAGAADFGSMAGDLGRMALGFAAIETSVQGINSSINTWREFSSQITLANAVAHGTAVQFEQMSQAAQNFALASKASITDVADALYFLNSAGYNTSQSLMAMTSIVQLSQSTMTSFAQAAQLVTTSISAYGLSANDSARVANLFVASAHDSQATVEKLSFSLRQVAPAASEVGMSIEQTVAYLDLLYNAGLSGQQAGTALRNVLVRLNDPVGEGGKLFAAMGIQMRDASGQMRDSNDVLKELANSNIDLSEATALVGRQSAVGFLTMLKGLKDVQDQAGHTTSAYEEHLNKIKDTNEAYRQAVAQMDTLDGAMTRMSHAGQELKLIFGQSFAPSLADSANGFADMVRKIKDTDEGTKAWVAELVMGSVAIGGISFLLARIPNLLGAWHAADVQILTDMAEMEAAMLGMRNGTLGVGAAMQKYSEAQTSALGQVGKIAGVTLGYVGLALAVAGVGAAMVKTYEDFKQHQLDDFNKGFFQRAANAGQDLGGYTSADLGQNRNKVPTDLRRAFNEIPDQYPTGQAPNGSPTGFANRATAYQTNVQIIQDQIKENDVAIKAMQDVIASQDKLKEWGNRLNSSVLALRDNFASANISEAIAQTGESLSEYSAALKHLSQANIGNLKQAAAQFYTEMSSAIEASSLSDGEKQAAIQSAQQFAAQIASAPKEVVAAMLPKLAEASADAQSGNITAATNILNSLGESNLGLAKKVAEQARNNNAHLLVLMRQEQAAAAAQLPQVRTELINYANQVGKGNSQVAKMLADISKADPKIWDDAMRDVEFNFNDLDRFMQAVADEARKRGIQSAAQLKQSIQQGFLPLLDLGTAREDLDKALIQEHQSQVSYAKALGKPVGDVRAMLMGTNNQLFDSANQGEIYQGVLQQLKTYKGGADLSGNASFKAALSGLLSKHTSVENLTQKDVDDVVNAAGKLEGPNSRDVISTVVKTAVAKNFAAYDRSMSEVQSYANQQGRKGTSALNKSNATISRAFGLQDDAQFQDDLQKLLIGNTYFTAEWFDQPLQKAQEQLDSQKLAAEKKINDFYAKSYKTVVDDIFRDTPLAANKALKDIIQGTGKVDGLSGSSLFTNANSELLKQGKGPLQDLLNMITGGLGKDRASQAQIEAARTELTRMGEMVSGLTVEHDNIIKKAQAALDQAKEDKQLRDQAKSVTGGDVEGGGLIDAYVQALLGSPNTNASVLTSALAAQGKIKIAQDMLAQMQALYDGANKQLAKYGETVESELTGKPISTHTAEQQAAIDKIIKSVKDYQQVILDTTKSEVAFWDSAAGGALRASQALDNLIKKYRDLDSAGGTAAARFQGLQLGGMSLQRGSFQQWQAQNGQVGNDRSLAEDFETSNAFVHAQGVQSALNSAQQARDVVNEQAITLKAAWDKMLADGKVSKNDYDQMLQDLKKTQDSQLASIDKSLADDLQNLDSHWDQYIARLKAQDAVLKSRGDQAGQTSMQGFGYGLQAGLNKSIEDTPSSFQVGLNAMNDGINKFSDLFSKMAMGMKVNFRQATASIIADIGEMIIKMMVMRAIQQAMSFMMPGGGGGTVSTSNFSALYNAYGGVGAYMYANGGAHLASAKDLFGGGVKQPGQTTHAIFGEGMMPEAFIPMMDGRTVQMAIGANGQLHIPLPSGQALPVSLRGTGHNFKQFADGGSSADNATISAAGFSAIGSAGGSKSSPTHIQMGDTTNHFSITNQGGSNNSPQDQEKMRKQLVEHINAIWDARETQFMQKMVKQGGLMSSSFSAKGGFGSLGR